MSTRFLKQLISQSEAARLRGCTRQAIQKLIKRGRLNTTEVGGRLFVNKDEVLRFEADLGGRPLGSKDKKKRRPKTRLSGKRCG
jgi:excisionase family DNA binding protein